LALPLCVAFCFVYGIIISRLAIDPYVGLRTMQKPIHRYKRTLSPETRASSGARRNVDSMTKYSAKSKSRDSSGNGTRASRLWYIFVLVVCIFVGSKYLGADDSKPSSQLLRESSSVASNEAVVGASNIKAPKVVPSPKEEPIKHAPEVKQIKPQKSSVSSSNLCGRDLSFDLWDESTWPTPYTPSYFEQEPESNTQAVLIKNAQPPRYGHLDFKFRVIGDFFAAVDLAYEKKCKVYITKDASWFWDTLTKLFFGADLVKDDEFWRNVQGRLGVIIIKDEAEAKALGKELTIISPSQQPKEGYYLTAEQIRNRRDTVFRKLIQLAFDEKLDPRACYAIELYGLDNHHGVSKYTVLSPGMSKMGIFMFNSVSGKIQPGIMYETSSKEHKGMTAQHVKSILNKLQMHDKKNVIFIRGDRSKRDHEEMKALLDDPELNTYGAEKETDEYADDEMLYLTIMADVFIADPTQWSLMVARIRYALGLRNTFVLTETKTAENGEGETLVSYVNDDNYLELYDRKRLGQFMG
jgi:hypothetical protein